MSQKSLYLIAYDISNDKRRTKLHNKLLDFGTPVQYSVFECHLDQKMRLKMEACIKKVIRPRKDSLRIYFICADCEKKIQMTNPVQSKKEETVAILA